MDFAIPKEWENFLSNELKKEYVLSLKLRLKKEKALQKKIFPSEREIFKAFELTSPEKTKVIILGQDPYHNPNQANGLCFSVKKNQALPPSLKNIYKEIEEDLGIKNGTNGDLSDWAKQGVLLINSSLTYLPVLSYSGIDPLPAPLDELQYRFYRNFLPIFLIVFFFGWLKTRSIVSALYKFAQ